MRANGIQRLMIALGEPGFSFDDTTVKLWTTMLMGSLTLCKVSVANRAAGVAVMGATIGDMIGAFILDAVEPQFRSAAGCAGEAGDPTAKYPRGQWLDCEPALEKQYGFALIALQTTFMGLGALAAKQAQTKVQGDRTYRGYSAYSACRGTGIQTGIPTAPRPHSPSVASHL
jgi:hypothetical protein